MYESRIPYTIYRYRHCERSEANQNFKHDTGLPRQASGLPRNEGFTLIELSIVLVIIGLIVGGVLVGQDLIELAQARSQMSQMEKYQAAVNTFRVKYNCLPGDCNKAATFGLGSNGNGNKQLGNDALVECLRSTAGPCLTNQADTSGGTAQLVRMRAEAQNFWVHLSAAGLIPGNYSEVAIDDAVVATADMGTYFPKDALGKAYLMVFTWNNRTYMRTGATELGVSKTVYHYTSTLNSTQANYIATKLGYSTPIATDTNGYFDALAQRHRFMALGIDTSSDTWSSRFRAGDVASAGWTACLIPDGGGGHQYNVQNNGSCNAMWELD